MSNTLVVDKEFCQPAFEEWQNIFELNMRAKGAFNRNYSGLRTEILKKSRVFTDKLNQISMQLFSRKISIDFICDIEKGIAASAHQPEISHAGIIYKQNMLDRFCRENKICGLNVIIDTDQGNSGSLILPGKKGNLPDKQKYDLDRDIEPLLFKVVPARSELKKILQKILADLAESELAYLNPKIERFLEFYSALSGQPISIAHTIVRRIYQRSPAFLEIPFSEILQIEEAARFFHDIMKNHQVFVPLYNNLLHNYRLLHKTKNPLNPFPDLNIAGDFVELPFWAIDKNNRTRESLFVTTVEKGAQFKVGTSVMAFEVLNSKYITAPKASLITAFLRLVLSDLFVHGKGGAKYDRFTDLLILEYFKATPPIYVTASADSYIFKQEVKAYEKDKAEIEYRRNLNFHIDKFLDSINWKAGHKERLSKLAAEKKELIDKITEHKESKISTAALTQEIKKIENHIRDIIKENIGKQKEFKQVSKAYLDAIYSRDFSYFLFD